ncbi:4-hydroxy-3-methylbut-2-enyl diphosphate reductase [Richelia intracellularis HM01]|uniref:4-hydroxy-3-methylbut-2-enyl diphosphate reductase n=1 Tax=Richelia intracellularis TaxID=1164990 RepID=UPI0002B51166|nr:4-hydroxy-3-methylbut-2-enyl diphosphate reductase [Richelia intracellularis HM01]
MVFKCQENWLPSDDVIIGITSGASTPDKVVEDIIKVLLKFKAPGLVFQSLPS